MPTAAPGDALTEIGRLGGGTVESLPEDVSDRKVAVSFLYNATIAVFESHGSERLQRFGKHHCIVRTVVAPTKGERGKGQGAGSPPRRLPPPTRCATCSSGSCSCSGVRCCV